MRGVHPERSLEAAVLRERTLLRGRRILIACSGGADSVALAGVLSAVCSRLNLQLALAYVHHGTRASAWQDEAVVLRVGATFGLDVRTLALDATQFDEANLREARYSALAYCARDLKFDAVATAHHAQDQSESVLLALFRGAGERGLEGIRAARPLDAGIELLRPLLRVDARALYAYCQALALPYAVDPTNAAGDGRRNAIRAALAALRPLFPGLDRAVARSARILGTDVAEEPDRTAARRWLRGTLLPRTGPDTLDFERVEALLSAIERAGSGQISLGTGVVARLRRGEILAIESTEPNG